MTHPPDLKPGDPVMLPQGRVRSVRGSVVEVEVYTLFTAPAHGPDVIRFDRLALSKPEPAP